MPPRQARKSVANWFGIPEEEGEAQSNIMKWHRRSMVVHGQKQPVVPPPRPEVRRRVEYEEVEQLERQAGMGMVGKMMHRHYRRSRLNTEIRFNLAEVHVYRPYFTVWVTSIQIIIFIVTLAVYGIAPINVVKVSTKQVVIRSNMVYEDVEHDEWSNLWIGPRPQDLILLGAKYSPCMRVDDQIQAMLRQQREIERGSACCIYNDKSGCAQTISDDNLVCSKFLAVWKKNANRPGTVCGLDPQFCKIPSNLTGTWKNDITEWPICKEKVACNFDDYFEVRSVLGTRGLAYKLFKPRCTASIRSIFLLSVLQIYGIVCQSL